MTEEEFFHIIGEVDERKVADAGMDAAPKKKSRPVWIKWGILAACLCLVAISAYAISFRFHTHKDSQPELSAYMDALGLDAKTVSNPQFFSGTEEPQITKDDLISSIKNKTVIDGTIDTIRCVRVQDVDGTWYIATMTVKVHEVLVGTADSEVHLVCASHYNFDIEDDLIPIPQIRGCHEGMRSVFVLSSSYEGSWMICGKEVYPSFLGEYHVIYLLDRYGDNLIYPNQNIMINIEEIR